MMMKLAAQQPLVARRSQALVPARHPALFSPHARRCRPVRFKEDDKNEELMQRRMAEESVRRMQEEENRIKQRLHQAAEEEEKKIKQYIHEAAEAEAEAHPTPPHPPTTSRPEPPPVIPGSTRLEGAPGQSGTSRSMEDIRAAVQKAFMQQHTETYSESVEAPRVGFLQPAFTRRREIFVGRVAMVGFLMACIWEMNLMGHPGVFRQIQYFTGIIPGISATALLVLATFNGMAGLAPGSPTYDPENQQDIAKRPPGFPLHVPNILDIKNILGISGFGFTKRNELFQGRLAMLGLLVALFQEVRMGGYGPIAQLGIYLHIRPDSIFYQIVGTTFFLAAVAVAVAIFSVKGGSGVTGPENDIY